MVKVIILLPLLLLAACRLLPGTAEPTAPLDNSATVVPAGPDAAPTIGVPQTWTAVPTPAITPIIPAPTTRTPTPTATPQRCDTPGEIITGTYPSLVAGPTRNYRVYLPPCYGRSNRLYPTLYMFHGNIHTDSIWDELGLDETAEKLIQSGQIPPLIIAMPDGGFIADISSGGPNSFEAVILDEFIPFIEQSYCAWPEPDGRAIGGMSRGGYWSLEIAFRFPDQFVSVGGHSASLYDTAAGPEINPQFTGLTNDLGDLRIYFDIGEDDYLIPNIQKLHEDMVEAERPHEWVLNEGSHEDAYWALHTKEYLLWYSEPWPFLSSAYPTCQRNQPPGG